MSTPAVDVLPEGLNIWEVLGVVACVGAIVGGGIKWWGLNLPQIRAVRRQFLLFALGVASLVYGLQLDNFRISKLGLEVPPHVSSACPAEIPVTGTIRVHGGAGDVTYRLRYLGRETDLRKLHFDSSGGKAVPLERLKFDKSSSGYVQLRVLEPSAKASAQYRTDVQCYRPIRGFSSYQQDGYSTVYPHGWVIKERDRVITTYHRTTFQSREGDYFVRIDWSPAIGHVGTPALGPVEVQVNGRRVQLGPHDAREWRYIYKGKPRVDYIFLAKSDGFGIVAEGPDFPAAAQVAKTIASHIRLR